MEKNYSVLKCALNAENIIRKQFSNSIPDIEIPSTF
jgi:hypothetical protein